MSVKRQATSELNHENWDDEEPADANDMGQFKAAPKDVLEKRVIRTARRRNPVSSEGNKSVFSGFGGFNKAVPSSFDFLANVTNGSKNTNGTSGTNTSETPAPSGLFTNKPAVPGGGLFGAQTSTASVTSQSATFTSPFASAVKTSTSPLFTTKGDSTKESPFKIQPATTSTQLDSSKPMAQTITNVFAASTSANESKSLFASTNSTPFKIQPTSSTNTAMVQTTFGITTTPAVTSVTPEKKTEDGDKTNEKKIKYFSKLKGLNEAVSDWISKHVAQTPLCILSPIFEDYEKYLKEITKEYEKVEEGNPDNSMETENSAAKTQKFQNSFSGTPFTSKPTVENAKTTSSFGNNNLGASSNLNNSSNTNTIFSINNTGSSPVTSQGTKTASSPFAINNANSSLLASPNTKSDSPFAINNTNLSPSKTHDAKTSINFGISNTGPSSFNTSQDIKSSPFGKNSNDPTSSPSNAGPKTSLFSGQNNSTSSSPDKTPAFSFGTKTSPTNASSVSTATTGFSFGTKASTSATTSPFTLSTSAPTNPTSTAPFSFGIGKPFSFSPNTVQQPSSESVSAKEQNEEDEPPKVEYTPVKEDNSVYEKKCKIFVKKDGNFVDKGVGTLYIKTIEGNVKHQLLVRANTNLGTVLLNLVLAEAIPTKRMGKNNVMLACIPTPDAKPPPTTILIRVKTGEEADDLLETLNKYKA